MTADDADHLVLLSSPKPLRDPRRTLRFKSSSNAEAAESFAEIARGKDPYFTIHDFRSKCQRAPNINERIRPREVRLTEIVLQTNTKVRDTLNFPLLA